ncbi:hypothetical protein CYMTET_42719 [Cymbomonas tetramitiformis]|uniref:HRDC domain-containing protein n=1 Tax=Cymbomonas tetramitiformis TaxID=36881 RepID=A0AAE0F186_9CHLO|nr:hypothetical protein CYMTET_42719 [Cymbomonas tetramitiformis]
MVRTRGSASTQWQIPAANINTSSNTKTGQVAGDIGLKGSAKTEQVAGDIGIKGSAKTEQVAGDIGLKGSASNTNEDMAMELCEYERKRLENIARNAARLADLGLANTVVKMFGKRAAAEDAVIRPQKRKRISIPPQPTSAPTRSSLRLASINQADHSKDEVIGRPRKSRECQPSDTRARGDMTPTPDSLTQDQKMLYEELRKWRQAAALRLYRCSDPSTVCTNRTLCELVQYQPRDEAALLDIWGLGAKRIKLFGAEILSLLPCIKRDGTCDADTPEALPSKPDELTAAEREAYEDLREFRKSQAETLSLEAYKICQNRTLCELVRSLPRTLEALPEVWGLGEVRIAAYGEDLLEVLNRHRDAIAQESS